MSTPEYGTTVDMLYTEFPLPVELPEVARADAPDGLRPWLDAVAALALESVFARKSRELQKILAGVPAGRAVRGAGADHLDRLQPVYHITVGRALADD